MAPVELVNSLDNGISVLHEIFNNDKCNTKYDKCNSNYKIVIKMLIEPIIEKNAYDSSRNTCQGYLKPEDYLVLHYISADTGF